MRAERMSPLLALGLLVSGLCSRVHCLPENVTPEERHKGTSVDGHSLASSNTDFAFSLYKQLALKNPNKNVIFSPLSISIALAFLSLGARGPTVTEILEGLKFNLTETPEREIHQGFQHLLQMLSRPSNELQLSVGNTMFVQEQLKLLDKFREDALALYTSEAFSTNFKDPETAKSLINDYVKNKTRGKIVDLFKDLDPLTKVILVNYIYFKAQWRTPFDPKQTYKSQFHVSKNKTVEVPMMSIGDLVTPYFRDEELDCTLVELTYTSNDSALFILPDEGKMQDLEAKLIPEMLTRWRESLYPRGIHELNLPRFSIATDYKLKDILSQLEIKKVFTQEADLSGITDDHELEVSQVVHKAVLDVGEEGTEGAAATGVKVGITSINNHIPLSFNRPFLIAIVLKDTQSIIFLGKVTNPSQA
ncbi:serpin A3-8 isoform X2 [Bos indicus]|nr:serpin A3-8 isoform X4 [Bos indicus x Bos taurus]XP_027377586.1 serpin A3-8 isoform X4 [Bos indicus x Bos taurus]XP_027377587.1 serpin A3-8 isoform X4 [Bos indicus x Bos taurus]DAA17297.1 TPA: SERPINA3-8 [Bos taurus]